MASKVSICKQEKSKSINLNLWVADTFKLGMEADPKLESASHHPTDIAGLFIPFVKFIRFLGFCPFKILQDKESNSTVYEFKWLSFPMLYSFLVALPFVVFTIWIFSYFNWFSFTKDLHDVLEFQGIELKEIPQNISVVTEFSTRLVPGTFPMFSLTSIFGTIFAFPSLHILLNQWSAFQQEYKNTFPQVQDPFSNLKKYRDGKLRIFPVIGGIAIFTVAVIVQSCSSWKGCLIPVAGFGTIAATMTMLIMVGGHGCQFFMFRTSSEAFTQIAHGIESSVNGDFADANLVHVEAKSWSKIILLARKQVELAGKAGSVHLGFTIFINFIYLCLGVFATISSSAKLGSALCSRGYILLMFSGWGFTILAVKAFMCERITEKEKRIVFVLRKLEVHDHVPALIQINNLIDLIVQEPAEIRFWNTVTFNKSFLLQLIGQVATYLIVLIQFDNMG